MMLEKKKKMRGVFVVAIVVSALFLGGGMLLYKTNAQLPVYKTDEVLPKKEGDISSRGNGSMREVHIANNGLMLLRGAQIVSISENTIRVSMEWDSIYFVWEVHTKPFSTEFITAKGKKGALADLRTGDILTITGQLTKNGTESIIDAQFIRE